MIPERLLTLAVPAALPAAALIAALLGEPFTVTLLTKITIFALAGAGLNIALGLGGLVSFGHAAFFGLGGYAAGILAWHARNYVPLEVFGLAFTGTTRMWAGWLAAILVSGLAALAIGALSLRTTGIFFIMITLAFAQMFFYLAVSWPAYGGEDGLSTYVRNGLAGLNTMDPLTFFWIAWALLAAVLTLTAVLRAAPFGLALEGARQNAARIESLGLSAFRVRLAAFTLSGMVTGLAGALYVDLNRFVSPAMLSWNVSGELIVFLILGGTGRLAAPVVGAAIFFLFEHWLGAVSAHWGFWLGLVLLGVVLFARGGLIGALARD